MRKMDLQRTITEGTASRALQDMERDTHRTARNLVDLCLRFAKGPFERRFFTVCRDILEDDGSPCFSMLRRALSCFDRQTLVTFGVNVGFEGCSRGAKRIRETEAREGFNVPWAIRVAVGDAGLSRVYTQRLISEAVELGVHVFILEDHGLALSDLRQLLEDNPTCAFCLITRGRNWELVDLTDCHNFLMYVDGEGPLAMELCGALEDARMPYGVWLRYDDRTEDLEDRLEKLGELGSPLALLLGDEASPGTQAKVNRLVTEARSSYAYPFVPIDLPGDLLAIDRIISDDPCSLTVLPDGRIQTVSGIVPGDIRSQPLKQILRQALPKR